MVQPIVRSNEPITLLGAGSSQREDVALAMVRAPTLVAADGGAARALAFGYVPDAVIGDLDSLTPEVVEQVPRDRVHKIPEQETTDFDKCLRSVAAPLVLGVGLLGGRVDHQLAAMNVLVRRAEVACILLGASDIVFAAPPEMVLDLSPGVRVSLFPMAPVEGRSTGLHWPIDGIPFSPGGRVGTSNVATGPVRLIFSRPGMLLLLPRSELDRAVSALMPEPSPT